MSLEVIPPRDLLSVDLIYRELVPDSSEFCSLIILNYDVP